MYDVHIEFAHIYKDQPFSNEQVNSILILNQMLRELDREGKSHVTSVLVDDYHVESRMWDDGNFLAQMERWGSCPDTMVSERSFVEMADSLIASIPDQYKVIEPFRKNRKSVLFFSDGEHKFALKDTYEDRIEIKCVLLSCAWMLCKLGLMPFPKDSINAITGKEITSSPIVVSILDKQYMHVEENVMRLLTCLGFEQEKQRIQYVFY